jgi:hypothetical protein
MFTKLLSCQHPSEFAYDYTRWITMIGGVFDILFSGLG